MIQVSLPLLRIDRPASEPAPAVVLDTNVVLDWLVFGDPSCARLVALLMQHQLRWHATLPMRSELAEVLARQQFQARNADGERALAAFDEHALLGRDDTHGDCAAPRCRDADDQKFIDLACAVGARWLFTRDRALLDLASAATARGIEILTPTAWNQRHARTQPAPLRSVRAA